MQVGFILDEDTEKQVATFLARNGHDVERVVKADELGPGSSDDEIRRYARRTDRIIVTHDNDHLKVPNSEHEGVLFVENQHLPAFRVYEIIAEILTQFPDRDRLRRVVPATEKWLQHREKSDD